MGLKTSLNFVFKFQYKADFDNELTENEIDHVFVGKSDEIPFVNLYEVASYKYMTIQEIQDDITRFPENYTVWFRIIFAESLHRLKMLV